MCKADVFDFDLALNILHFALFTLCSLCLRGFSTVPKDSVHWAAKCSGFRGYRQMRKGAEFAHTPRPAPIPARKKSSQKSTRPRGAKDADTFPGAIGRNNACVRADLRQVALGGRKRLSRVGECIVADGGHPCQRQPLRGHSRPSQGGRPFHVVRWSPVRLFRFFACFAKTPVA
jgi:hypothetical protein